MHSRRAWVLDKKRDRLLRRLVILVDQTKAIAIAVRIFSADGVGRNCGSGSLRNRGLRPGKMRWLIMVAPGFFLRNTEVQK